MNHVVDIRISVPSDTAEDAKSVVLNWCEDLKKLGNLASYKLERFGDEPKIQALRTIATLTKKSSSARMVKNLEAIKICTRKGLKGVPLFMMEVAK